MKYVDIRDLPPCSFSPQCLRLIDDLDVPAAARSPARLSHIADFQDERQLRQLRSHVPGCPTCSALLVEARRMRTQQRLMLHHFLIANENRVPSTTSAIFAAIQSEQASQEQDTVQEVRASTPETMSAATWDEPSATLPIPLHRRFAPHRNLFQYMLTLATVAAVILAALGVFYRFGDQPPTASTQSQPSSPNSPSGSETSHYGWNSVVIGLTLFSASGLARNFAVYNFDVVSKRMGLLFATPQRMIAMKLEAVSGDGQSLLYGEAVPDQQIAYKSFSLANPYKDLYSLSTSQAGNAIWMDADSILIQDMQGAVLQVNAQTGKPERSWQLKTGELTFYNSPFLYFTGATSRDGTELYRINLDQHGASSQKIANASAHTRFLLSPDRTTIFYADQGSANDGEGVYAVNSDGSHLRMIHRGPALPIGYAEDRSLMFLQQVGTRIEVIKQGVTSQMPEQVVLADAAPQAISLCGPSGTSAVISLCPQNVALDPYGQGLLLHAYYADGSHALVYDDLATGNSSSILDLTSDTNVQLPGWSKIASPDTASVNSLACCA